MRLAVLIPLYDGAGTVGRTLASLHVIRRPAEVEVVVVDDGSRDGGPDLARRLLADSAFASARVLSQENRGSSAARNRALAATSAPWVLFLDADDELATDPLELLDGVAPDTTALLAATLLERAGRRLLRRRPPALDGRHLRARLSAGNPLPICALLARRSALAQPFDERLRYLEDWDFLLRNPGLFAHVLRRPERVLARIHVHGGNKSSHYAALGSARERIADAHLARAAELGPVERNNWRLQRAIGRRLQRAPGFAGGFLAVPCAPLLYAKFLAHALLGRWLLAADPYAPGR